MKKIVVAHAGSRDGYKVAEAFSDANRLKYLVTDFYNHWSSDSKRNNKNISKDLVKSDLKSIFQEVLERTIHKKKPNYNRKNILLGRRTSHLCKNDTDIFAYNNYLFESCMERVQSGSSNKLFLFNYHPHPLSVKKILSNRLDDYPFAKNSISRESEFSLGGFYIDRIVKEIELSDKIVVASSFSKNCLVENGTQPNKVSVIPYGVSQSLHLDSSKRYIKNGKFKILYLGSAVQRKGLGDLLLALRKLKSSHIELSIVGRTIMDSELTNEFSDVSKSIKINISKNELLEEMANADVMILPSLVEGFGHSILESMAFGLPVITTSNTCGGDIINHGENGFLVPIQSPDSISFLIESLISMKKSGELELVGRNAKESTKHYTWDNFKLKIVEFYLSNI